MNHHNNVVTRTHPGLITSSHIDCLVLGKNVKTSVDKLSQIFNKLGTGSSDLSSWTRDRSKERKVIRAQSTIRMWLVRRNYRELSISH